MNPGCLRYLRLRGLARHGGALFRKMEPGYQLGSNMQQCYCCVTKLQWQGAAGMAAAVCADWTPDRGTLASSAVVQP